MISTNGPKKGKPREGQFGIGFGEWKDFVTLLQCLILSLSSLTFPWTMPVSLTK